MELKTHIIDLDGRINYTFITLVLLAFYLIAIGIFSIIKPSYIHFVILGVPLIPVLIFVWSSNISYSVLLYIALLPIIQHFSFQGVLWGDFLFTPHMIINFVILTGIFFQFVYNYNPSVKYSLTKIDKLLLLFFLLTILSLIFPYSIEALDHTKRWLLFYTGVIETITFFFIVIYFLRRDESFSHKLIIALVLTSFSSLIIALSEFNTLGFSLIDIFFARMRIGFGYHNTNLYGIHSALMIPILFYAVTSEKFKNIRALVWFSFIILVVLSVLTFNRGTFLVLGLQLLMLFFIPQTRKKILGIIFIGIVGLVYYSELVFLYLDRFIGGQGSETMQKLVDKSAYYRFEAWAVGFKMLFLYPFGIGAGGFQYGWEKYGSDPTFYLGTPHQLFLTIGVDYGLPALIVFISILIVSITYSNRLSKKDEEGEVNIFKFLTISLFSYAAYGMVTVGELSHLTGFFAPNNGYTIVLMSVLAMVSYYYFKYNEKKSDYLEKKNF